MRLAAGHPGCGWVPAGWPCKNAATTADDCLTHGRFHPGMWVRPVTGRKNELLAGQSLRPGGVTDPACEGQQAGNVPLPDTGPGVVYRRWGSQRRHLNAAGQLQGLTVLGQKAQAWLGRRIVKKVS